MLSDKLVAHIERINWLVILSDKLIANTERQSSCPFWETNWLPMLNDKLVACMRPRLHNLLFLTWVYILSLYLACNTGSTPPGIGVTCGSLVGVGALSCVCGRFEGAGVIFPPPLWPPPFPVCKIYNKNNNYYFKQQFIIMFGPLMSSLPNMRYRIPSR